MDPERYGIIIITRDMGKTLINKINFAGSLVCRPVYGAVIMRRTIFILMLVSALFCARAYGEENARSAFKEIADDAVSFFAPLSGLISFTDDKDITINIGSKAGVREGMRLKVFREGEEFTHPVTGERLGKVETEVGDVEVVSVRETESTVVKISGEVKEGDRVRISRGSMKVLFYQTAQVDWGVGDQLFRALKNTGRFDIEEASKDRDSRSAMLEEINARNAVFGLFVRQVQENDRALVSVSFYHPDGKEFYTKDVYVTDEEIKQFKFGYDYLKKVDTASRWVFEVSSSMQKLTACDVDGDGNNELVAFSDDAVEVLNIDHAMKTLYRKETSGTVEAIWLDCDDLDGDGRAEIALSLIKGYEEVDEEDELSQRPAMFHSVESKIFSLRDNALTETASVEGFMRIVEKTLYEQSFDRKTGFSGKVSSVQYENGIVSRKDAPVPAGTDIYDFYPAGETVFVIDGAAFVNLKDRNGHTVWRSAESLGGFIQSYRKESLSSSMDRERWYVKDRVVPYAGSLLLIKRIPTAETAQGLGYSATDIVEITSKEGNVTMKQVLAGLDGTIHDFTVLDDKLVILVRHGFGQKLADMFSGKSPFKRNIYLFPLKED